MQIYPLLAKPNNRTVWRIQNGPILSRCTLIDLFSITIVNLISGIIYWSPISLESGGCTGMQMVTFGHHHLSFGFTTSTLKFIWQMISFRKNTLNMVNMKHATKFHMKSSRDTWIPITLTKNTHLRMVFYQRWRR